MGVSRARRISQGQLHFLGITSMWPLRQPLQPCGQYETTKHMKKMCTHKVHSTRLKLMRLVYNIPMSVEVKQRERNGLLTAPIVGDMTTKNWVQVRSPPKQRQRKRKIAYRDERPIAIILQKDRPGHVEKGRCREQSGRHTRLNSKFGVSFCHSSTESPQSLLHPADEI